MSDVEQDPDEAQRFNDLGRTAELRVELENITRQLSAGFGRRGQPCVTASANELARIAVRNNIATALKAIHGQDQGIWLHLSGAVRTGMFRSYRPDRPILWQF